jgi:hypothetical protein
MSENNHIVGWNSERPGVQFANTVRVRTFERKKNNYGVNTGNTEIETEQNMSYQNVEAAYKTSRNTLKAGQNASRQQRIRSRDKKRDQYKKQIASNIRIIRQKLEEFQATPPDASTLSQFQGAMDQDLHRMATVLQEEDKLRLGIFNDEIAALNQMFSEIQQLRPADSSSSPTLSHPNISPILSEDSEIANRMRSGINEVEQLLQDMGGILSQKPTMHILAEFDTMIAQADQTIRMLLSTPKTPEEREKIVSLIGRLKTMKGMYNQYVLHSVGKKGGSRRTQRKTRRSHKKRRT